MAIATAGRSEPLVGPIVVGADHVVVTTARGTTTVALRAVAYVTTA